MIRQSFKKRSALAFAAVLFLAAMFCAALGRTIKASAEPNNEACYRASMRLITDAGKAKNPFDLVPLPNTRAQIKSQGYTRVQIYITLNVAEIDDGYQHIYIYKNTTINDDPKDKVNIITLLSEVRFEHGTALDMNPYDHELNNFIFYVDDFTNDDFVIRYDASGSGSDNWLVANLRVKFEYLA